MIFFLCNSLSVWTSHFRHFTGSCCSPQWEGPLLVTAKSAAVDGGGAWHCIQVVRAVGKCGNPLTVPLCLLFPEDKQRYECENETRMLFNLPSATKIEEYKTVLTNIVLSITSYIGREVTSLSPNITYQSGHFLQNIPYMLPVLFSTTNQQNFQLLGSFQISDQTYIPSLCAWG